MIETAMETDKTDVTDMTDNSAQPLAEALAELINEEVSLDPSIEVTIDTDLIEADVVDSLGVVQIVTWLEDRLSIKIAPTDVTIQNFGSVAKMARFASRLSQ